MEFLDYYDQTKYIADMENQEDIKIFSDKLKRNDIRQIAKLTFVEMAKAVIDIKRKIIAIGGELHADAEAVLLENGSKQADLWGINLYPGKSDNKLIEYTSLINIRPSIGNRTQHIDDPTVRKEISNIIDEMLKGKS